MTLAAYAIGLIPFVLIRSAVATFFARKDTATPVKAALIGIAVNLVLKIALMAPLAQVGLALGTGLLTCDTLAQAEARSGMDGHNKGAEAAAAALLQINAARHLGAD